MYINVLILVQASNISSDFPLVFIMRLSIMRLSITVNHKTPNFALNTGFMGQVDFFFNFVVGSHR